MRIVRVRYHQEHDGWWAESSDVEGWTAAADTYDGVHELALEGLTAVLGEPVYVVSESDPASLESGIVEVTGTVVPHVTGQIEVSSVSVVPASRHEAVFGVSRATIIFDERLGDLTGQAQFAQA